MRRYWIQKSQIQSTDGAEAVVVFKDELFHHIFDVCRQEVGHHFEVLTEDSKAYLVEVTTREKKQARAKVIEERTIPQLPRPHIHLALSIPRFPVMDSIIERAVEMGVTSILPFYSDYSFIRKASNLPSGKQERWQKIVISATQQCGRGELLKIHEPIDWSGRAAFINPNNESWCLFAYEGAGVLNIHDHLAAKKKALTITPQDIWIIVGSEGGFSESEVVEMRQLGLDPVTLGSQVLRVETACLTLVSVLKYEFELLK
ncbi:MAG: 16S rRNA (uracil(1498)-N(3))-methyltransferase [Bdellovibrionaceae bacterium]|nr:16S rRNA (uracil(1498)-N(3))-methyltransferase [Bdellovibrio sp.]